MRTPKPMRTPLPEVASARLRCRHPGRHGHRPADPAFCGQRPATTHGSVTTAADGPVPAGGDPTWCIDPP
ncbi:hypothetical protein ACIRPT_34215 [Streptomyces sp. NPDC101227]|uniref:hypothetical protein n=1 Tax=Streptomyces sp. NPDC101227 TaxID=3366136 RepID=UPI0037F3F350